jgi:hypothetical protein
MPAMSDRPRRILTAYWLAPILVGLGYAAARTVAAGLAWPGLYAQSPFALAFFSGLLIAFAWRPVLLRVPWSRSVALALVAAVLLGTGPLGDWALARLVAAFHLAPFPYVLPRSVVPELAGLAAAAALLVLLFRPEADHVNWPSLRARLAMRTGAAWLGRFSLLGAWAVALWLLIGWGDGLLAGPGGRSFAPMVHLNPWAQLTGREIGMGQFMGNGAGLPGAGSEFLRGAALLALYWVRALALYLPLLPIALVVRASRLQITLIFTVLLFIVGDFAPLMMDQPYPSTPWLLSRTALGAVRAVLLAGAATLLIGQIKGKEG